MTNNNNQCDPTVGPLIISKKMFKPVSFSWIVFFVGTVLLNAHLWGWGAITDWILLPSAIKAGEWWRLITHPFVHAGMYHLILDASAFVLLYNTLHEKRRHVKYAHVVFAGLGSLLSVWFFEPQVEQLGLCGLSGIDHGLMMVAGLEMIQAKKERKWGVICLAVLIGKCIYEMAAGQMLFTGLHMGMCGVPFPMGHGGGALGGAVGFLFLKGTAKQAMPGAPEG